MKTIVYKNEYSAITVVYPANSWAESMEELVKNTVPLNTPYKILESLNIDNTFFNAYEFDQEAGAKINISKAKEIWLEHYRTARTPLLAALDLEYMRADEAGNLELKKEIASKKQALRDVTLTPLPDDLAGIKATWPDILN
jgi:hypothetical protein